MIATSNIASVVPTATATFTLPTKYIIYPNHAFIFTDFVNQLLIP